MLLYRVVSEEIDEDLVTWHGTRDEAKAEAQRRVASDSYATPIIMLMDVPCGSKKAVLNMLNGRCHMGILRRWRLTPRGGLKDIGPITINHTPQNEASSPQPAPFWPFDKSPK